MNRVLTSVVALALIPFLSGAAVTPAAKSTAPEIGQAQVAAAVGLILDRSHFLGQKFDDAISQRFFDNYLKEVDPNHLHFLQSDIAEFSVLGSALDDLTLDRGDTTPAHKIYARFVQRLAQRVAFVKETLAKERFDFTGKDTWTADRQKETWPQDLAAARQLWRGSLRYEYLQEKLADKKPDEIARILLRRYDRTLRTANEVESSEIFEIYLNALAHAYDPHTDFMGPSQMEDFAMQMNLRLCGVGATLESDDGYCTVKELITGGPAARSGRLQPGDRVVAVQQGRNEPVDIVDMPLHKAINLIRGPKGSRVRLTVIPASAPGESVRKIVTLVRDEIKLEEQEAKAYIADMPWQGRTVRLGVIDLPVFYADMEERRDSRSKSASEDVARLLMKLNDERIDGLVLDLRRNGGGSLEEAIAITGFFIPAGPVVQTREADGQVQVDSDDDGQALYTGPLVVLTGRMSASASEIVAGALQDHGRALIVGDPSTFGKGTVQFIIPIADVMRRSGVTPTSDTGSIKMTIAKFYRPGGASTQLRGVTPDITLPSPTDVAKIAEMEMDYAIAWDAVRPSKFEPMNLVGPYVSQLRAKSSARIESDIEFAWIREDAATTQKKYSNPAVSLNEAERLAEKKEIEKRLDERDLLSEKLPLPDETVYSINLVAAGKRGLPAPQRTAKKELTKVSSAPAREASDESDDGMDPVLTETKRILADYISLVRQPSSQELVGTPTAKPRVGLGGPEGQAAHTAN